MESGPDGEEGVRKGGRGWGTRGRRRNLRRRGKRKFKVNGRGE